MRKVLALFAFLSAVLAVPVVAEPLFVHEGCTDPLNEGWTHDPGRGITVGPVCDDENSGVDAWFLYDDSSDLGSHGLYRQFLSGNQVAEASTNGWKLSARLLPGLHR